MAHTILVRLDVDDEYADIHPDITATDYLEGSKAYGWEVITERVFTESEVRAIMQKMSDGFEANMRTSVQFPGSLEVDESVVHDQIDEACDAFGIVLDPA